MISNKKRQVNDFSDSLWSQIEEKLKTLDDGSPRATSTSGVVAPKYAAFDADGTLWDTDMGEAFFDYQIHHCGLKNLPADPWKHYMDWKKSDPTAAYAWLAQISAGYSLEQVHEWARKAVAAQKDIPVFKSQKKLIDRLRELGFEVYVVTASVKWAVEPAAQIYDIDYDHVLGITTKVVNGIVTDQVVLPITWRQGKADALLKITGGVRPFLCAGNTLGDIALLEAATDIRLAVSTQDDHNGLFAEEEKLRVHAREKGWLQHHF